MTQQNPTDGPIHTWFGLSYSNYQVLHRTLMQSMPIAWQERMVACLEELADAYRHIEQPECFEVQAATEHIVNEMGDEQLKQARITADWYRGETPPEGLDAEDLAEWEEAHEDPEGPAYSRDGEELDGHQRVFLPAADPIPHYRHAYIEPRLPEPDPETFCPFGEDEAPGAGCIKPGGHDGPHLVTPGDADLDD